MKGFDSLQRLQRYCGRDKLRQHNRRAIRVIGRIDQIYGQVLHVRSNELVLVNRFVASHIDLYQLNVEFFEFV